MHFSANGPSFTGPCIERIDIDEHATGFESAECGDRMGEPSWNLDRDSGSRLQAQYLAQIRGKGVSNIN
jgi:hypothetical protein